MARGCGKDKTTQMPETETDLTRIAHSQDKQPLASLYVTSRGTRLCLVHFQHPLQILSPLQSPSSPLQSPRTSRITLWPPPTLGVGEPDRNVSYNFRGVDVVLYAKFEPCRSNSMAAYREQTHTHTHSHLYYIDLALFTFYEAGFEPETRTLWT